MSIPIANKNISLRIMQYESRDRNADWVRARHLTKILEFTIISDVNWISYQRRPLGTGCNILESADVGGNVLKPNDIILFVFRLCLRHGPKLAFRCRPSDRQKSNSRRSVNRIWYVDMYVSFHSKNSLYKNSLLSNSAKSFLNKFADRKSELRSNWSRWKYRFRSSIWYFIARRYRDKLHRLIHRTCSRSSVPFSKWNLLLLPDNVYASDTMAYLDNEDCSKMAT